jgi:hypothetical protein
VAIARVPGGNITLLLLLNGTLLLLLLVPSALLRYPLPAGGAGAPGAPLLLLLLPALALLGKLLPMVSRPKLLPAAAFFM